MSDTQALRSYETDPRLGGLVRTLREQESSDKDEVKRFCVRYRVDLKKIGWTFENERPELMYFFTDNLGGYSIEGIRRSLDGNS